MNERAVQLIAQTYAHLIGNMESIGRLTTEDAADLELGSNELFCNFPELSIY
jgi:hypothetical protein